MNIIVRVVKFIERKLFKEFMQTKNQIILEYQRLKNK
jgi:hypothetical protein